MKLKKGMCFLCPNNKVARQSENQEICKIITLLLPKDVLNSTEFDRIQASLRFCPICYHKLIIANRTRNKLNSKSSNEVSTSSCLLCKNEENLFQINEWTSFKKITEDLALPKNSSCVTCSDCLYYLEIKNEIKMKLFSKYPKLRQKYRPTGGESGKKLKPKFTPKIKLKSVPLLGKNKRKTSRKRKFSEISNDAGDSSKDVNINFDTLKKLRPLKDHKKFSRHKLVKTDSKFLNQVPYVLVSIWNSSDLLNNTCDQDKIMQCNDNETLIDLTLDEDIDSSATESNNFKDNGDHSEMSALKLNNSLHNNGFEKHLVVNVTRTNIEEYIQKPESESTIEKLVEEIQENYLNESYIAPDSFLEEVENKNKRKSVSFAEEKNVEIEYFENESNIKFIDHSNSIKDPFQAAGKKYNKGILKRDDNMNGFTNNSESKNDDSLQILEATEEVSDGKENHEQIHTVDSSSDNEDMFDLLKSKKLFAQRETAIAEESNENDKRKKDPKRSRPKPLSKKKRRDTIVDSNTNNLVTDDSNVVTSDEPREDKSEKSNVCTTDAPILDEEETEKEECEIPKRSRPKPLSKKKRQDTIAEDYQDSDTNNLVTDDCNVVTSDEQREDKSEKSNVCTTDPTVLDKEETEKEECEIPKRSRPKPLSKKKRRNTIAEDYQDSDTNNLMTDDCSVITNDEQREDKSEKSNVCTTDGPVLDEEETEKEECEIPKRSRPKPLSKKKRRNTIAEDYQDSDSLSNNLMTDDCSVITNDEQREDKSEKSNICTSDAPLLDEEETEECERKLSNTDDEQEGIFDSKKNNGNISESASEDKGNSEEIMEPASKDKETNTTDSDEEIENGDEENKSEETEQDQAGTTVEQNESIPRAEIDTDKISSTNSTLEDENPVDTDNATNVLQFPEAPEENDVEESSQDNGKPNLAKESHDSTPDREDSQLVNNYVNSDDDGDHFINSQSKEKTVLAIEKDEERTSSDNSKLDLSMDRFEDNEDLGITDVDSDNINSILSHIFPPELPDDRLLFDTSKDENNLGNSTGGVKNKLHEDETLNVSQEKKKKKVTFCDVT